MEFEGLKVSRRQKALVVTLLATWGMSCTGSLEPSVLCAVLSRVGLRRLKHEAENADTVTAGRREWLACSSH